MKPENAARSIAGECLAMRARRMSRVVTRIFDNELRAVGITPAQLSLLVVIERRGPVSPSEVAGVLDLEKSTLSRNIGRMDSAGWLRQSVDGNRKQLRLTASGRKLLVTAYPLWRSAQKKVRKVLGDETADLLTTMTS